MSARFFEICGSEGSSTRAARRAVSAAWESPEEMLDAVKFLSEGRGFRGPQLTVLTPGRYRFNPRLCRQAVIFVAGTLEKAGNGD